MSEKQKTVSIYDISANQISLKEWKPFADEMVKIYEFDIKNIMKHIRECSNMNTASIPPSSITHLNEIISKRLEMISHIKKITEGIENAEKKVGDQTAESTASIEIKRQEKQVNTQTISDVNEAS